MRSTVTAQRVTGAELDARYWAGNLRHPVRFAPAVAAELALRPDTVFIEISPHPVLLPALRTMLSPQGLAVGSTRRGREERTDLLASAGELYLAGHPVLTGALFGPAARYVPGPPYPWQRSRHWLDRPPAQYAAAPPVVGGPVPDTGAPSEAGEPVPSAESADALVRWELAAVTGLRPDGIDTTASLRDLGLDSLLTAELRHRLELRIGTAPPAMKIINGTVADLVAVVSDAAAGRPS
jgi:acyl transferase domain-containing protein